MKRILTAAILIPLVLLAVFKAPNWLFTLLVGSVAILALKEYLDLVEAYGVKPMRWLTYGYVGVLFLGLAHLFAFENRTGFFARAPLYLVIALFLWPFVYLITAMGGRSELREMFPRIAMSGFGVFYVGVAMLAVVFLQAEGWYPLVFTFFAVWAGDSVAMYTGKAIGRHKMSPRISPNKTWEGAVGSVVGSVVFCLLLAQSAYWINLAADTYLKSGASMLGLRRVPLWWWITTAVVINVAAQLGDLVESLIKRGAGVKDSGTILPGHGGILDRIDALLFAAPVALIIFGFLQ